MRVLVAPDKFKGTLSAEEAARAIAAGWMRARPGDEIEQIPMADGGEGTLEALVAALGGERKTARVSGPLGDPVDAEYGIVPSDGVSTAVVEMARASGLALVPEQRRNPLRASTRGTGELILTAAEHGPSSFIVCIGGSATNDGGAGMAQAIGARLLDAEGAEIGPGGEELLRLAHIDVSSVDPRIRGASFLVACDVDNPLVGPNGASAVYGPQKGASPNDVVLLDRALGHYAAVLHQDLGIDIRETPGAGAAGGLGGGLIAFAGARLRPGIEVVMEAVGFQERIAELDLVITGEGSFDAQSLRGKTAMGVVEATRRAGIAVAVLAGRAEVQPDDLELLSMAERFGLDRAMEDARAALEELAAEAGASREAP
ncbi:MAG: glycerate kinase [Actinomycetota bacterium]